MPGSQKINNRLIELCALYGEKSSEADTQTHAEKENKEATQDAKREECVSKQSS